MPTWFFLVSADILNLFKFQAINPLYFIDFQVT